MNPVNQSDSNPIKIYLAIAGGSAALSLIAVLVMATSFNRGDDTAGTESEEVSTVNNQDVITADDIEYELPESRAIRNREIDDLADAINKLTGNDPNDGHPSRKRLRSFDSLSDEEKNRIWWKIASVAATTKGEETKYRLTTRQAIHLSGQIGSSELDVFRLFREGVDAEWRTNTPPTEPDSDTEPEKSRP